MMLDHLGCSNTRSELVSRLFVAILRLHLAPKPLEMAHFEIKRKSKRGHKCVFLQVTQDAQAHLLGRFGTKKRVQIAW